MTITEALAYGEKFLRKCSPSPSLDSLLLLGFANKKSKEFLYGHGEADLSQVVVNKYSGLLKKRKSHWPIAYLINCREFYGNNLYISKHVLIPSADSEILVDLALKNLSAINVYKQKAKIWDIATGSGCLIISILHAGNFPNLQALASDFSTQALAVARINAKKILGAAKSKQLRIIRQDIFSNTALKNTNGPFDMIISNPPYIPTAEIAGLQQEVACYEPKAALDGGPDGLKFYRRLREIIQFNLAPKGCALLEINSDIVTGISGVFNGLDCEIYPDLEGRPRVIKIRKP